MTDVNLEMQAAFLKQVDEALTEAMERFAGQKQAEPCHLERMKTEVIKARSAVQERLDGPSEKTTSSKGLHAVA